MRVRVRARVRVMVGRGGCELYVGSGLFFTFAGKEPPLLCCLQVDPAMRPRGIRTACLEVQVSHKHDGTVPPLKLRWFVVGRDRQRGGMFHP